MIHLCTTYSGNWVRQFLVRVLETRAVVFDAFKAKLQKLIEDLFFPPVEDEGIALDVLQQALADEEYGNKVNNNNIDVDQDDKQQQQTRRKSFSDVLCEKTRKARYAELDEKVLSGIISYSIYQLVLTA